MAASVPVIYFLYFLSVFGIFAEVKSDLGSSNKQETDGFMQGTPAIHRWRQYNYTDEETIDLASLEDAFHPVILTSEIDGNTVNLTMTYMAKIHSIPYWDFKFDGVSYTITQGHVTSNGSHISSIITLPVAWKNNQYLGFRISSEIGVYYTELDFDELSSRWVDFSTPRLGIKMTVPSTMSGTDFNMTIEKTAKLDETCFQDFYNVGLFQFVDGIKGGVKRLKNGIAVNTKKKTDTFVLREYGFIDAYHDLHAEVVVYSTCTFDFGFHYYYVQKIFKDTRLVRYATKRISAPVKEKANITFVDGVYGSQDEMKFDETFAHRSISCEAFGNPKPYVTIEDAAGHVLPTVELKHKTSMSSHVIASLDAIPLEQAVGNYTCTATAGEKTITRTIEVKKVVRPTIVLAELVVNNTEEIIAICIAKGNPAPDISFSVNYAKDDVIEKRPLLETESTWKLYHKSQYSRTGGESADMWFEYKADRCPKPKSVTYEKHVQDQDVTEKMISIKPLPFLSRHQVNRLFCRADGFDNVYVTQEVTENISSILNTFMRIVNKVTLLHVAG